MARTTQARYYVRIDTYWQNSPDRFVGPFLSRNDAQKAIDDIQTEDNVWLSTSSCGGDIRNAIRVYPSILTATEAKRSGMRHDYGDPRYNVLDRIPRSGDDLFEMEQAQNAY